jgi:hypothetical protein
MAMKKSTKSDKAKKATKDPATTPVEHAEAPAPTSAPAKTKARKAMEPRPKKASAIDAAVRVLEEVRQPMNCQEMIDAMAAKKYWTSPGGATPGATLYSAILREITAKGKEARFVKTDRGKFGLAKK